MQNVPMDARGRFITLEGGEGAGKSVQARALAHRLINVGIDVVLTREPGGSPHAEALRKVILSGAAARFGPAGEALLFTAARIDHVDATIEPALARGAWVVSDRFADSTGAYQGAAGQLDRAFIERLETVALAGLKPDLTLILDLPAERGLERAALRRGAGATPDRFEQEGLAFHQTLREAFIDIARAEPQRCIVVDASRSQSDVEEQIWNVVRRRFSTIFGVKGTAS